MTKYILVSGGVVSGIGKGVIGMHQQITSLYRHIVFKIIPSLFNRLAPENDRFESHCYQDRPLYEHRCWNYATARTR